MWALVNWGTNADHPCYHENSIEIEVVKDTSGDPAVGATVTLLNKNDAQQFQLATDANGQISAQDVYTRYQNHDIATGAGIGEAYETRESFGPFTLVVEYDGHLTVTDPFELTAKTTRRIVLQETPEPVTVYVPTYSDSLIGELETDALVGEFEYDEIVGEFENCQIVGEFEQDELIGEFEDELLEGEFICP